MANWTREMRRLAGTLIERSLLALAWILIRYKKKLRPESLSGLIELLTINVARLDERQTLALADPMATKIAAMPGNPAHNIFYRVGFHLLRKHFYVPIPDDSDLSDKFWNRSSALVGLDMNDKQVLDLMERQLPAYLAEFRKIIPIHSTGNPKDFYLINGGYMAVDAHLYYGLIRLLKPKRIVEIGAGNSTLLAGIACLKNRSESRSAPSLTAIEPYPWKIFREGFPGFTQLIEKRVQDVDLEFFETLGAGDILFIDSSHVLRSGNDVQYEYLEILPRLKSGVLIHIHDISLPKPYPRVYFDNQLYWNEQYLLQAFLAFNSRFKVLWAGNYMLETYRDRVLKTFPEIEEMRKAYPSSEPTAFWIQVRES